MYQTEVGDYVFLEEGGYVQVWTDGAAFNNGRHNAAAGWGVFWDEEHPLNDWGPVFGPPTNIRAEILAVNEAIEIAAESDIEYLSINTDSEFVIKAVNEYIPGWKQNGWYSYNGNRVKNQDLLRQLDQLMENNGHIEIEFSFCQAHTGIFGNDQADKLAKRGARQYSCY